MGNVTRELKLRGWADGDRITDIDIKVLAEPGKDGNVRLFDLETGRDLTKRTACVEAKLDPEIAENSIISIPVGRVSKPIENAELKGLKTGDKIEITRIIDDRINRHVDIDFTRGWTNVHFACTVIEGAE